MSEIPNAPGYARKAINIEEANEVRRKSIDSKREKEFASILESEGYKVTKQFIINDKEAGKCFLRPIDYAIEHVDLPGFILLVNFDGSWHFSQIHLKKGGTLKDLKRDIKIIEQSGNGEFWDYLVLPHWEPNPQGKKQKEKQDDEFTKIYTQVGLKRIIQCFENRKVLESILKSALKLSELMERTR